MDETPITPTKPFQQFLIEQRSGSLHSELSEKLQEVVAAVAEHGKGGVLSLTITIKPAGNGTSMYYVADEVKVKIPSGERGASLFFADGEGNLSRTDPRQPELPLREVPAPAQPMREVAP